MLTHIRIRNFKRFDDVEFELGSSVVLIGPNNSGKTTALQALALWDIGLKRWIEKRGERLSPEKRPGVTINRRDLVPVPIPLANLLWRDLHVRGRSALNGKQQTQNILIEIIVDGVTQGTPWSCGLEFDYANAESLYCRPLRLNKDDPDARMPVPRAAMTTRIAFLPPMSGLADREFVKEKGEIGWLIGQGQTAQVLRNLCYKISKPDLGDPESAGGRSAPTWDELTRHVKMLFGVDVHAPVYLQENAELVMTYQNERGIELDLSAAGRGLQQTLLLLAHLYGNRDAVLLLDEPDAHLEVLRQRQTYQLLTDVAKQQGSQIIAASHSEVILNEAADRDIVVAFVGKPHRIDDRGSQLAKSLKEIGFDQYYQAEQRGWVLYLEGSTDLAILRTFADTLNHPAAGVLESPFVHYVGNQPMEVSKHFWGLKEAKPDLVGVALFDRLERSLPDNLGARAIQWRRRELENYLCAEDVLLAYARHEQPDNLWGLAESDRREQAMRQSIEKVSDALRTLSKPDPWSFDIKATDDFLDPLFERYFKSLGLPNLLRKTDYHVLAHLVPRRQIDAEIVEKLDAIVEVAGQARPRQE